MILWLLESAVLLAAIIGRDPRKDPRSGDVLRHGSDTRQIQSLSTDALGQIHVCWARSMGDWGSMLLYSWLRWSKNATVVSQSEDSNA